MWGKGGGAEEAEGLFGAHLPSLNFCQQGKCVLAIEGDAGSFRPIYFGAFDKRASPSWALCQPGQQGVDHGHIRAKAVVQHGQAETGLGGGSLKLLPVSMWCKWDSETPTCSQSAHGPRLGREWINIHRAKVGLWARSWVENMADTHRGTGPVDMRLSQPGSPSLH